MSDADHSPVLDGVVPPVNPPVMDLVPPPLLRQTTLQSSDFGQIVHINGQSVPADWEGVERISGWLQDLVMNNTTSGDETDDETERENMDSSGSETEEEGDDNELYMASVGPNE